MLKLYDENKQNVNMGHFTKVRLSCYLVLLIAKPVKKIWPPSWPGPYNKPNHISVLQKLSYHWCCYFDKSSCFTSPIVPNLEAKSVAPELTTRDSEHCWWSLLCVVNLLNKMGRAMSRPDRTAVISICLLQWCGIYVEYSCVHRRLCGVQVLEMLTPKWALRGPLIPT